MRIQKNRSYVAQENTPERLITERIDRIKRSRRGNLGFNAVTMLEGNVAYLDLSDFTVCFENRYLEEYNINALGYTYLMEHEQAKAAEAIFLLT